jgi:hypothetical protein
MNCSTNDRRVPVEVPSEESLLHLWWSRSSKNYQIGYRLVRLLAQNRVGVARIPKRLFPKDNNELTHTVEDSLTKSLLPRGKGLTNRFFSDCERVISLKFVNHICKGAVRYQQYDGQCRHISLAGKPDSRRGVSCYKVVTHTFILAVRFRVVFAGYLMSMTRILFIQDAISTSSQGVSHSQ